MRYILNDSGYIETISFNYQVECNNKSCIEYTGEVPTGYENLSEWSELANINAYKIVEGNLTFDSTEDTRLQELWASQQISNSSGGISGDTLPIGSMIPYGNATPPTNWLVCDGSAVSRITYAELFSVIGTSYGAGDGSTTFNLPNKKGKVSVGLNASDTDFNTIGKTSGEKKHTLTVDEIPSHTHGINFDQMWEFGGTDSIATTSGGPYGGNGYIKNTGGGQSHNNLQPYEVDCWIIKAFQSAGTVANITNTKSDSTTDTYSCEYINKLQKYSTEEQVIGTWSDDKPIYRKVVNVGNLPNAAAKDVPHNISNLECMITMRGNANNGTNFINIPNVHAGDFINQVALFCTKDNIRITAGSDRSAYIGYVILEYTKTND